MKWRKGKHCSYDSAPTSGADGKLWMLSGMFPHVLTNSNEGSNRN